MVAEETTSAAEIDLGSAPDRAKKQTMTALGSKVSPRPLMFEEAVAPVVEGMDDEQRYLLDLNGYLVLEGALSPPQLERARADAAKHLAPSGGAARGDLLELGSVEALAFHDALWPVAAPPAAPRRAAPRQTQDSSETLHPRHISMRLV
jgi:hypothetical protein